MDWYQHSTSSHDDPDISDAMDEFGPAGYTAFFITLELYGDEYNHVDPEGWLKLSRRFLARKLRLSSTKVEQILNFYSERQRIIVKTTGNDMFINCPKFVDIASNWTKRKHSPPTEALQRPSVAPTAIEEEKEKEEKKKKKIPPTPRKRGIQYSDDFEDFWSAYPKKVGKDAAWRAWEKRSRDRPATGGILQAIHQQQSSEQWTREGGQFIPNPATWINQGRWNDEIGTEEDSLDRWAKKKAQEMGQ